MERGFWGFPRQAFATAEEARAERAARLRSKRAERQRVAMARSTGSEEVVNYIPEVHAPAPAAGGETLTDQVQPHPSVYAPAPFQVAPVAPESPPRRRLRFRRAPVPPAAPLAEAYHSVKPSEMLEFQPARAQQWFGAASASSADGFEARFTRIQDYFAAEHDVQINACPAISAMSTTEVSFVASLSRPALPRFRRQPGDAATLLGWLAVQSETADNFTDVGASSSSAVSTIVLLPLFPEHPEEPSRGGDDHGDGGAF